MGSHGASMSGEAFEFLQKGYGLNKWVRNILVVIAVMA